jgi:O-acetyl-ADP-ribose deacetylase
VIFPSKMESIIEVSEIPTVTLLYEYGRLDWNPVEGLPLTALPEYNDKVAHIRADITKLRIDAIVNAAKPSLRGGSGVDGVIHRAAGPGLLKECLTLQGCSTGEAKITEGYNLPADKVIHTVGPVYGHYTSRESAKYLRNCYLNSLNVAVENGCKTLAFPAVSTGIYGYPSKDAAGIAIEAVRDFIISPAGKEIEKVVFCTFTEPDVLAYEKMIP